jgi:predicted nuclease of predicted toxin-antitoxin system
VNFLIDRCVGHRLADWLRVHGHDVFEVTGLEPDPGDQALLVTAAQQGRVLVTIDTNFGGLIYGGNHHAGLVRLPNVPAAERIALFADVLQRHRADMESAAVITVKDGRIRISR